MAAAHGALAVAAIVAAGLLASIGGVASWRDAGHEAVRRLASAATLVFGMVGAFGLGSLLTGGQPGEGLHLLYGLAMVGIVPLGLTFAADAPPRAQSGVLAVAGLTALLLGWRLFATG